MMKSMPQIVVKTAPRAYSVIVEEGLLSHIGQRLAGLMKRNGKPGARVLVIASGPVRRLWGKPLLESLRLAKIDAAVVEMPDGERAKNLKTSEQLTEKLARAHADRNSIIVAFGGGVVGDVAGFVASIYMRGIDVVQVPTTLLAQVDAAIGGKTGVNLRAGKNLVGHFHNPLAVFVDPTVLGTLPERQFRAGLFEVLKCGVIGHPALFAEFDGRNSEKLRGNSALMQEMIVQAVKLKAAVVAADERESDLRRVLNFGHTIGHALETESGYKKFLHGEAVAWGMIAACWIAVETGHLAEVDAKRISDAVISLGPLPAVTASDRAVLRLLQSDKKTIHGVLHFVLPTKVGRVSIVKDVPERAVVNAVRFIREMSATSRKS